MLQRETCHFNSARSLDSGIPQPRMYMAFEYVQAMRAPAPRPAVDRAPSHLRDQEWRTESKLQPPAVHLSEHGPAGKRLTGPVQKGPLGPQPHSTSISEALHLELEQELLSPGSRDRSFPSLTNPQGHRYSRPQSRL